MKREIIQDTMQQHKPFNTSNIKSDNDETIPLVWINLVMSDWFKWSPDDWQDVHRLLRK